MSTVRDSIARIFILLCVSILGIRGGSAFAYDQYGVPGAIPSHQLPNVVPYLVEAQYIGNGVYVPIQTSPGKRSHVLYNLQPGEFMVVRDSKADYEAKIRLNQSKGGYWQNTFVKSRRGNTEAHFYYHSKIFEFIPYHYGDIDLEVIFPTDKKFVTVFSEPGLFTWVQCKENPSLCVGWVPKTSKVVLLDTLLQETDMQYVSHGKVNEHQWKLFYYVRYEYVTPEGQLRSGQGWIPSYHAHLKVTQVSRNLLVDRTIAGVAPVMSMHPMQVQTEIDPRRRGDQFIKWKGGARFSYMSLKQTTLVGTVNQMGISFGGGLTTPMFGVSELELSAHLTLPIAKMSSHSGAKLFRFSQFLWFDVPYSLGGLNLKAGIGAYYLTMFTEDLYGFTSLLSLHGKIQAGNNRFFTFLRFAPVDTSINFNIGNRDIGGGFGFVLEPHREDAWSVFLEVSDLNFTVEETGTKIDMLQLWLGVQKNF